VFLLGTGASVTPELQAEWRAILRSDWESKKALVPVIHGHGTVAGALPPFLRSRKAIYTTNFDAIVDQLRFLLEHPAETLDPRRVRQTRIEHEKRLKELKDYALALKAESAGDDAKLQ
jgi:hypothetical protein